MHKKNISGSVCPICACKDWVAVYQGNIRSGSQGNYHGDQLILRCLTCGIDKLHLGDILNSYSFYSGKQYREFLGQGTSPETYYALQDSMQINNLKLLDMDGGLRGKIVADIGCAAGGVLSYASGVAKDCLAIEPCVEYHHHLQNLGYRVFESCSQADKRFKGLIDIALSSQVIEHVENPLSFLKEIKPLLADSGRLVLTTPNRNHILMKLLPAEFRSFFYRAVHLWYFDMNSLEYCCKAAGYRVLSSGYTNQYGLSNAITWLRDKVPRGNSQLDGVNSIGEKLWNSYLDSSGQSDTITITLGV